MNWNTDIISGLLVLLLTVLGHQQSQNLSYYGGVFVKWVLLILLVLGVALLIKGLYKREKSAFFAPGAHPRQVLWLALGLVAYLLVIPWLGFLLTSIIAFSVICLVLTPASKRRSRQTWFWAIGVGTSVSLLFFLVFRYALLVPLPIGALFG